MKSLLLVVIVFGVIFGVLIWSLLTLSERIDNLEDLKIDSYQESTRMRFDKVHAMNMKLIRQQEEHDKKIEVLRLRLDKLIEKEKRLTFDSTDPGYHRELLKALTELKDIKDREKKLNEEIEEILQTCDQ
jgi:hypothetical protein